MKKINIIKVNAISKLLLSASAFTLCASAFLFSINKATANDNKEFEFPTKLTTKDIAAINNSGGKYQMSISTINNSDNETHWYILVWNTQTGRSNFYYGNVAEGTKKASGKYTLPSNPL